jgi:hypothetical protein
MMVRYLGSGDPGVPILFGSIVVGMFAAIADLVQQIIRFKFRGQTADDSC